MPPLPTTFDDAAKNLIEDLERRHKYLQDFQIPRLRTCKGPLSVQQQYAAEIREDVEVFARKVELLDVAVDDQHGERNRKELRRIVDGYLAALTSLKKESRAALLASKRAIDASSASNREELLRSSVVREKQDLNEKVAEDALMTTSNNVTEALQRTIALMQGELEKSVLSTQLLDQSTASLKSASSTHDVLDGLMVTSKHLITALEKSDWLDRLLILAALLFFILVVLFILKQRLVDKSLRIAFWWTRFIPSSSSSASRAAQNVADAMEKGALTASTTNVAAVVSSVVITATSSLAAAVSASSAASLSASSLDASSAATLETAPEPTTSVLESILPSATPTHDPISKDDLEDTDPAASPEPEISTSELEIPSATPVVDSTLEDDVEDAANTVTPEAATQIPVSNVHDEL